MNEPSIPKVSSKLEQELINRTKSGDLLAFGELFKPYEGMIYSLLYNMMGNAEDAEDTLQETALRAFRGLSHFEGRSSFSTWLYRIGVNTALEKLRKITPRVAFSLDDPVFTEPTAQGAFEDWSRDPEALSISQELRDTIEAALLELPEEYRTVIVLKDVEGLSNKEVSDVLHESLPAVKSRLHRARLFVRQRLQKQFQGEKHPWKK